MYVYIHIFIYIYIYCNPRIPVALQKVCNFCILEAWMLLACWPTDLPRPSPLSIINAAAPSAADPHYREKYNKNCSRPLGRHLFVIWPKIASGIAWLRYSTHFASFLSSIS